MWFSKYVSLYNTFAYVLHTHMHTYIYRIRIFISMCLLMTLQSHIKVSVLSSCEVSSSVGGNAVWNRRHSFQNLLPLTPSANPASLCHQNWPVCMYLCAVYMCVYERERVILCAIPPGTLYTLLLRQGF